MNQLVADLNFARLEAIKAQHAPVLAMSTQPSTTTTPAPPGELGERLGGML